MEEKFKINRKKIEELVNQYEIDIKGKNEEKKAKIKENYVKLVIDCLGTNALKEAIQHEPIRRDAISILERRKISEYYSNEECLQMIEGLSNYEIVGDWQYFRTVEPEYLFKLSKDMQEIFAKNFAIGNNDAKECLLKLWKENIKTMGTDIKRKYAPGSTNSITIQCDVNEMRFMLETLRKNDT